MSIQFGENTRYSFKELYEVNLKLTQNMKIGNREFVAGEVIAEFDKVSISNTQELKSHIAARGGYDNRALVNWDETREVAFSFSQGVFSNTQFALLSNSKLLTLEQNSENTLQLSKKELLESNESSIITLSKTPITNSLFIYNSSTGAKIDYTTVSDLTYNVGAAYTEVIARYDYEYNNGATIMVLGRRLLNGYLRLEGRTRLKDDDTGRVVTGIITIPRLKLMSDLFMQLGKNANPVVANFQAVGYPVGVKGEREICNIIILNDDIDADI